MRRLILLGFLGLLFSPWFLCAAPSDSPHRLAISFGTRDGKVVRQSIDDGPIVDLIIEFRDTPLFLRGGKGVPPGSQASVAERQASIARVDQLSRDLARIARIDAQLATQSYRSASAQEERFRIERTFFRIFSGASVRIPREDIAAVRALPYVAGVYADKPVQVSLDAGVQRIKASVASKGAGTGGSGIVVAVIDTGIDYTHPALGGGLGPAFKVIGGWNFVSENADPQDDNGHGTHVSGIIAANGDGVTGVAPGASLLAYKALDESGSGKESTIIAAVERAADPNQDGDPSDQADVVNMSLGSLNPAPDDPLTRAVENAATNGMVFCVAAGNDGDFFTIASPANAPSAIAVGASDSNDKIATFSSRGPLPGSMTLKPEVVAPGVNITSTRNGGGTLVLSGTSMAAPYVAGVAALVKALHRDWPPAAIRSAVVNTARSLGNDVMTEGAGRADPSIAVAADILASPVAISFGNVDGAKDVWTASGKVTISNPTTSPKILNVSTSGQREGVQLVCTPSSFTLDPGGSQVVTINLTVSNASVPSPEEGSLSFGGNILIEGSTTPIHIPWAFGDASQLTINTSELAGINQLVVLAANKKVFHFAFATDLVSLTVPAGAEDIIALTLSIRSIAGTPYSSEEQHLFFLEKTLAPGAVQMSLAAKLAPVSVILDARDELGHELLTGQRRCSEFDVFQSSGDSALSWISLFRESQIYAGVDLSPTFSTSPFSSRFTLSPMKTCEDPSEHTLYTAYFPPTRGLEKTVTLSAPEWLRQPIRMLVPQSAAAPSFREALTLDGAYLLGGFLLELPLLGPPPPLDSSVWTGTLLLTPEQRESDAGGLPPPSWRPRSLLYSNTVGTYPNGQAIESPSVRVIDGQAMPLYSNTPSPADYRAPLGSILSFGDSPVHPEGQVRAGKIDVDTYVLRLDLSWSGPIEEKRPIDDSTVQKALYDASGHVIRTGDLVGPLPGPDSYRVQLINTGGAVAGLAARATYTGTFDIRAGNTALPMFSALRIVDGNGVQTSRVPRNMGASLVLGIDLGALSWRPPRPGSEAVQVQYRPHGSGDWRSLEPVVVAEENTDPIPRDRAGVGTVFHVDLSPATTTIDGLVDLRLYVPSPSGDSVEYLLEPGIFIGDPTRRRAAPHEGP